MVEPLKDLVYVFYRVVWWSHSYKLNPSVAPPRGPVEHKLNPSVAPPHDPVKHIN